MSPDGSGGRVVQRRSLEDTDESEAIEAARQGSGCANRLSWREVAEAGGVLVLLVVYTCTVVSLHQLASFVTS